MKPPRLFLADDHPVVIAGLRKLLEPQFEIVGTAEDGRELVRLAPLLRPDVILLDISMPLLNGLSAARQIRKLMPGARMIFLTMHADIDYVKEAFRAGASGYILKRSVASEMIFAIEEVLRGKTYLTPVIAAGFHGPLPAPSDEGADAGNELTQRQREVLQLLAEGHTGKEIAALLHVTVQTVEYHKAAIRKKLHLRTTAELVAYAIQHKMTGE
ncbi:MAG: response regulator transcription factor [Acidobacteria bacterium]|nr:response regulator transcription factor [Acidobacteriota bacterium]